MSRTEAEIASGLSEVELRLRSLCGQLKTLLDDPYPGLITWCQLVHDYWEKIAKLYEEN